VLHALQAIFPDNLYLGRIIETLGGPKAAQSLYEEGSNLAIEVFLGADSVRYRCPQVHKNWLDIYPYI